MELEQHRIVHESILKGKDLVIQKLRLQLAVKDKMIARQQAVLVKHGLQDEVGYQQLALLENSINAAGGGGTTSAADNGINPFGNTSTHQNGYAESIQNMQPSSPPRSIGALGVGTYVGAHRQEGMGGHHDARMNNAPNAGPIGNKYPITQQRLDQVEAAKNKGKGGQGQGLDTSLEGSYTSLEFDGKEGKDVDDGFLLLEDGGSLGGNAPGGGKAHNHGPMFTSLAEPRAIVPGNSREGGGGGGKKAERERERDRKEERDRERQAQREKPDDPAAPTSHHFFPAAQAGSGNAVPVVVPAPQGAVVTRNERPRKRPMHKPETADRPTPSGFSAIPASGAGGGAGNGPKVSPRGDTGMEVLGKSNNPNPAPNPGQPGPRRAKAGYVPSSWEAKPVVQVPAGDEASANSHPSGKVSPIGILSGSAVGGGSGGAAPYQNSTQAQSQAQASMLMARQQQQQMGSEAGPERSRDKFREREKERERERERERDRESKHND
jgi:hypothetical protein